MQKLITKEEVEIQAKILAESYKKLPQTYQRILLKLTKTMLAQSEKGRVKYGYTMDDNANLDPTYWENHLLEELSDGLVYMQKLLEVLGEKKSN